MAVLLGSPSPSPFAAVGYPAPFVPERQCISARIASRRRDLIREVLLLRPCKLQCYSTACNSLTLLTRDHNWAAHRNRITGGMWSTARAPGSYESEPLLRSRSALPLPDRSAPQRRAPTSHRSRSGSLPRTPVSPLPPTSTPNGGLRQGSTRRTRSAVSMATS